MAFCICNFCFERVFQLFQPHQFYTNVLQQLDCHEFFQKLCLTAMRSHFGSQQNFKNYFVTQIMATQLHTN